MTFGFCSEEEAAAYLSDRTFFFKICAHHTLFEHRVGGELDGRYSNLDLGHLKLLASLDRALHHTLPPMTLDVERFARAKLVREVAERPDGDGRPVVSDHLAALNRRRRNHRVGEIKAPSEDACCDALVEKYALPDDMPLWACLEPVSFGSFISLYLFCAERWGDRGMCEEYFQLRQSKAARNSSWQPVSPRETSSASASNRSNTGTSLNAMHSTTRCLRDAIEMRDQRTSNLGAIQKHPRSAKSRRQPPCSPPLSTRTSRARTRSFRVAPSRPSSSRDAMWRSRCYRSPLRNT